jgi:pimeloyl-ACP methyl ester carboxylesterase
MNLRRLLAPVLGLAFVIATFSIAIAQDEIELEPVGSTLMQLESVAPVGWEEVAPGSYTRGSSATDPATLAMQAVPLPIEQLWPALLPQLSMTEIPEPAGTRSTEHLDWTIYEVDIPAPPISVRLALADGDGRSYIVLLQSGPDDHEDLVAQVFDPAVEALAPLTAQATLDPATLDYHVEEVTFPGGGEGVELAGTLTRPAGSGRHPVIVLMNGSGAQNRDSSFRPLTELAPFAVLADAFAKAGIATLRYDDRGVGGSTGAYLEATVEDLTADGAAAAAFLATRDDVDQGQIGLLGHSEGGVYAASLAADDPLVAFAIGLATPALDGLSTSAAQRTAILRSTGTDEAYIEQAVAFSSDALTQALAGDLEAAEATLVEAYKFVWEGLSDEERDFIGDRDDWIERTVAGALPGLATDYVRSFIEFDPGADWSRVTVPVLQVFAGKDIQIITEQNEPAMRAALEAAGNEDFEVVILPDANHLFQAAETGYPDEYGELEPEFTSDLVPTLLGWLGAHVEVVG